jgi:hypothetical protein
VQKALANDMKAIGQKCGWVIPRKERRVLKLLRVHTRECEHEFVTKSPGVPRRKTVLKIQVKFAREELSDFQVLVQIVTPADGPDL